MSEFVKPSDLNYHLILNKVGAYTQGDEDFDVFKCPGCERIYLIESEADSIFSNPEDLSAVSSADAFECVTGDYSFSKGEALIGAKADDKFRVTKSQLLLSKWSWLLPN